MAIIIKTVAQIKINDIIALDYRIRITSVRCLSENYYKYTTEGVPHPGVPFVESNCRGNTPLPIEWAAAA